MHPTPKQAAKDLFLAQSLWLLYEVHVKKQSPDLLHAFRYDDTLPCHLLGSVGSVYDDGEPYLQSLLADITADETWAKLAGPDVTCPVQYSEAELRAQREVYAKWQRDVDRRQSVLEKIGAYPGWSGPVAPDEFDEMRRRFDIAKTWFLDREASTPQEREAWEKVWPFG